MENIGRGGGGGILVGEGGRLAGLCKNDSLCFSGEAEAVGNGWEKEVPNFPFLGDSFNGEMLDFSSFASSEKSLVSGNSNARLGVSFMTSLYGDEGGRLAGLPLRVASKDGSNSVPSDVGPSAETLDGACTELGCGGVGLKLIFFAGDARSEEGGGFLGDLIGDFTDSFVTNISSSSAQSSELPEDPDLATCVAFFGDKGSFLGASLSFFEADFSLLEEAVVPFRTGLAVRPEPDLDFFLSTAEAGTGKFSLSEFSVMSKNVTFFFVVRLGLDSPSFDDDKLDARVEGCGLECPVAFCRRDAAFVVF